MQKQLFIYVPQNNYMEFCFWLYIGNMKIKQIHQSYFSIYHFLQKNKIKQENRVALNLGNRRFAFYESIKAEISPYSQENTSVKFAGLQPSNFIKKRLQHRYFTVNVANFLGTPLVAASEVQ